MMIRVAYFSGTGGTKRAAQAMAAAFSAQGCAVDLQEIQRKAEVPNGDEEMLVLLFAVHAFNAPRPVYEWLAQLKPVSNIPAVVISVSAGGEVSPNRACRVSSIKRLARKGYRVTYERMLVMPSNFGEETPEGHAAKLMRVLPHKADVIAQELLAGMERRVTPGAFDRMMSAMMEVEKVGALWFGRSLHATEACTGCGWCARECPGANIRMNDGKPKFLNQCVFCTRCVYGCPSKAIRAGLFKFAVLKGGFDIRRYEESAALPEAQPKLLWEGLRRYFDDDGM